MEFGGYDVGFSVYSQFLEFFISSVLIGLIGLDTSSRLELLAILPNNTISWHTMISASLFIWFQPLTDCILCSAGLYSHDILFSVLVALLFLLMTTM